MAPRIPKGRDVADLLEGWAEHYKEQGDTGAAFVMRRAVKELRQLRDDVAAVTRVAVRMKLANR